MTTLPKILLIDDDTEIHNLIHKPIRMAPFRAQIEKHIKKRVSGTILHYGPLTIDVSTMKVLMDTEGKKEEFSLNFK